MPGRASGLGVQQGEPQVQRTARRLSGGSEARPPVPRGQRHHGREEQTGWEDPGYRERSKERQRRRRLQLGATHDLTRARKRLQAIVEEWKEQGCVDCGYDAIRVIDPDHLDPTDKYGHISHMIQMCASEQRIRTELAKCVPRCARCHREVTRRQRPSANGAAEWLPPSWWRPLEFQERDDTLKLALGCLDCVWR